MKKIYFLFFAVVFIAFKASSQTTVMLSPVKDNSIYENFPVNSNGAGENFHAGNNNGSRPRRALLKFDIAAGVPAGATITMVTLNLICNRTSAGNRNVSLHKLNTDWGEGTSDAGTSNDGDGVAATLNDATWPCAFSNGAGGCNTSWTSGGNYTATASATSIVGAASTTPYNWSSAQMIADVQGWLTTPLTNNGWIIIGDESTNQTAKRFASSENSVVADRPQLSVTYTGGLPVTLLYFKARELNGGVSLNWETTQEFNNDYFSIEHSIDGIHFAPVGKVIGNGTTSSNHSYEFLHEGVEAGRHFYRLAQTDIDRRVNYSNIILLNSRSKYFTLRISPNPVSDKVFLQRSANWTGSNFVIINQTGNVALSGPVTSNTIGVSSLAGGAYYIRLMRVDGAILSGQFIKL